MANPYEKISQYSAKIIFGSDEIKMQ